MEFEEVRPYVPGDDVRHIDWNVTARAHEPHVKEFREERQLTLMLALDVSGSMGFGSGGRDGRTDKRLQMARIAGGLAYAAIRNNDQVGLMAFTDHVELLVPPRRSRGHAWRVIREIYQHRPVRSRTELAGAMEYLGRVLKRRAVVCLVSDFLAEGDPHRQLSALASRHAVHGFLVWDPRERSLPRVGLVELEDPETGRRRLVDSARVEEAWAVEARLAALRRAGVQATGISTGDDPFAALMQHFHRAELRRRR